MLVVKLKLIQTAFNTPGGEYMFVLRSYSINMINELSIYIA